MEPVKKFYQVKAYPSGRFVVEFIEEEENGGSTHLVRDAWIPSTSLSPAPLREQAEEAALTFIEMDKRRRVAEAREANEIREFTVPAQ